MATKVVTTPVSGLLSSPTSAANTINNNFDALAAAIDNSLSRDGTIPNQLEADVDLDNNDLLNVGNIDVSRIDALSIYINGLPVVPQSGGGAESDTVTSVAGRTGDVVLTKADVGLSNVDNTSDVNKPVSTFQQAALDQKLTYNNNLFDLGSIPVARANLGSTAVGDAVFTAVDAAAARTAIGAPAATSAALTGTPTAPTATAGTNTTQISTTAFVTTAIAALSSVYQAASAVLASIVSSGSTGLMVRTSGSAVTNRTLQDGPGVVVTNADGVAGNPLISLDGSYATLTDASTIAVDLSVSQNFTVTLTANRTLGNPTNVTVGQHGFIIVNQDPTGTRTLVYGSNYKWVGGTPGVLSTPANSIDVLEYRVLSSTQIFLTLYKGIA